MPIEPDPRDRDEDNLCIGVRMDWDTSDEVLVRLRDSKDPILRDLALAVGACRLGYTALVAQRSSQEQPSRAP